MSEKTDREDVRVKDDVVRVESDLVDKNFEGPSTNFDLAVFVGGLADLVEGHDNDGGAKLLDDGGLGDEVLLALLQRDGVDNALALAALQASLNHFEVGGVLNEFVKSYFLQNSNRKFDSTLELANQFSHVTNFSFSDWSIPA